MSAESLPLPSSGLAPGAAADISGTPGIEPRPFELKGHTLQLYVAENALFLPNATTRLFSKCVRIQPGDVVFDLGSGVGPLAVWAALEPSSHVHAVEIVARQCELLRRNVELNHVAERVTVHHGSLFDPLPADLKADVIIGDLSGIAEGPARVLGWYPSEVPTGGGDGTAAIIPFLQRAAARLKPGGRVYFPIAIGLSDSAHIMEIAAAHFGDLKRVIDVSFPLSDQQRNAVLASAPGAPFIVIGHKGSRHIWQGQIYEATAPRR